MGRPIFLGQMDSRLLNYVTPPVGLTLTYRQWNDQNLCEAGSVPSGTMQYKLSTATSYSSSIPRARAKGTYTINWRILDGSWDSATYRDPQPISGTITAVIQ